MRGRWRSAGSRLAGHDTAGLRLTDEVFWPAVDGNSLESVFALEVRNLAGAVKNGDLAEGASAFLSKRKPQFKGQ